MSMIIRSRTWITAGRLECKTQVVGALAARQAGFDVGQQAQVDASRSHDCSTRLFQA